MSDPSLDALYAWPETVIVVDRPPYNGDLKAAYDAAPSTGAVIVLGNGEYNFIGKLSNSNRNTKENLKIVGIKRPYYDATLDKLTGGSVIQGSVFNSAKGFEILSCGIDRGEWVRANLASGAYDDAFVCIDFGDNSYIRFGDVIILQSEFNSSVTESATHCILLQNGADVYQTGIVECIKGYHGYVDKITRLNAQDVIAWGQAGTGAIFKSDANARCYWAKVNSLTIGKDGVAESAGILAESQEQQTGAIHIGTLMARNVNFLIQPAAASNTVITDVRIDRIFGVNISGTNNAEAIVINENCVDWSIGSHEIIAAQKGGINIHSGAVGTKIGSGEVKECGSNGYTIASPVQHGSLLSTNNTGWGILCESGGLFNAQDVRCTGNSLGGISAIPVLVPALLNGWQDAEGTFRAAIYGNEIRISGELRNGAIGQDYNWFPVASFAGGAPQFNERIAVTGVDANGQPKPLMGKIDSTGTLYVYGMGAQGVIAIDICGSYVIAGNV